MESSRPRRMKRDARSQRRRSSSVRQLRALRRRSQAKTSTRCPKPPPNARPPRRPRRAGSRVPHPPSVWQGVGLSPTPRKNRQCPPRATTSLEKKEEAIAVIDLSIESVYSRSRRSCALRRLEYVSPRAEISRKAEGRLSEGWSMPSGVHHSACVLRSRFSA